MRLTALLAIACIAGAHDAVAQTTYRLPLASNPGITAWFDHNATAGATKRFDCSAGTPYDGHHGTDFATANYTWVLAGAGGVRYSFLNTCPMSTSGENTMQPLCGSRFGNQIRIRHADDRVTISAHLASVVLVVTNPSCGIQIGTSGNSGTSEGPHLHYELRTSDTGTRLDLFGGSGMCNTTSYWVNQNGYTPTTQCQ